jgi:tetratricopeptide (TPR) repeat protein
MMMKKKIFFLLIIGFSLILNGEVILNGIITLQNSGGQPVEGAQITAFGANPVWSKSAGQFSLIFSEHNPGDNVVLSVKKKGLEVVNNKELIFNLPGNPKSVIKIVMCKIGEREKFVRIYHGIAKKSINQNFEKLLQQVQKMSIGIAEKTKKIVELEKQRDAALVQARELAEKFSRVNFDDISGIYKEAFEYFRQGSIKKALDVLNTEKLLETLKKTDEESTRIKKLQQNIDERKREVKNKRKETVQALILKARLLILDFQFDQAEKHYQEAIKAEPNNVENIFEFAVFLQKQNRHLQARPLYEKVLTMVTNEEEEATSLNNLGNLYSDTNQYKEAQAAYTRALKIREELAEKNPATYLTDVAMTLNNLGILYKATNQYKEAQAAYTRALKIYEELAEKNPATYLTDVAMTLNNLGIFYFGMNKKNEAINSIKKALEIRRKLARSYPQRFELDLCNTLIVLSFIYKDILKTDPNQIKVKECLFLLNQAVTILGKYTHIPRGREYLDMARTLKQEIKALQAR